MLVLLLFATGVRVHQYYYWRMTRILDLADLCPLYFKEVDLLVSVTETFGLSYRSVYINLKAENSRWGI